MNINEGFRASAVIRAVTLGLVLAGILVSGAESFPACIIIFVVGYLLATWMEVKDLEKQKELSRKISETFPDRIYKPSWEWEKTGDEELDAWYEKIR